MDKKKNQSYAKRNNGMNMLIVPLILFAITLLACIFCNVVITFLKAPTVIFGRGDRSESVDYYSFRNKISADFEVNGCYPAEYNSYMYYDEMTESEQIIYNIFEYAFLNCAEYIAFENVTYDMLNIRVVYDELESILWRLACDTPLLEQNIHPDIIYNDNKTIKRIEFVGVAYSENNSMNYRDIFSEGRLLQKISVIPAAEKWVRELPEDAAQAEKALALFERLSRSCKYVGEDEYSSSDPRFLYDVFITGKTFCDGYSNALSLLYKLAGIPCYETLTEKHTWVRFNIDGKWYNADASSYSGMMDSYTDEEYEGFSNNRKTFNLFYYFGFTDADAADKGYEIAVPMLTACDESFFDIPVVRIDSLCDENIADIVEEKFDGEMVLFICKEYPADKKQIRDFVVSTFDEIDVGTKLTGAHYITKSMLLLCYYSDN
ncbi:MAG: transglutaminase domain-containing protein [Oscillospiraceae bacterium]